MPAASSWVRGQGSPTERTLLSTHDRGSDVTGARPCHVNRRADHNRCTAETAATSTAAPATAPAHSSFKAQHFSHQHDPRKRKLASSGTWKPESSQGLLIKHPKPARVDTKRGKGSNSHPPRTSAKCQEDADAQRIEQELNQKLQEMEDIKRKRRQIEAQQVLKAASALQKQQEEQKKARKEVASIAQAMESSGMLAGSLVAWC